MTPNGKEHTERCGLRSKGANNFIVIFEVSKLYMKIFQLLYYSCIVCHYATASLAENMDPDSQMTTFGILADHLVIFLKVWPAQNS